MGVTLGDCFGWLYAPGLLRNVAAEHMGGKWNVGHNDTYE